MRWAVHVCREVGLPVAGVARGDDLVGLDEEALAALVRRTTVFASCLTTGLCGGGGSGSV